MYLTLRETPDGEPVLATADPRVIAAVLRTLVELVDPGAERPRLLKLVDHLQPGPGAA